MPFYLTRDPVPSADMRNVFDNAQNLDLALNDITSSFWSDRLGRSRMSWFGLESAFTVKLSDFESRFSTQIVEQETTFDASQADKENRFQAFLDSSGYVFLGDYEDGPFQFGARNQYIRYNNQYYRLNTTTDVGFTTTGTDATSFANDVTHFVLMDGDTLRQNLNSSDDGQGAWLVAYIASDSAIKRSVAARLRDYISVHDYWFPSDGDDYYPAFNKAMSVSPNVLIPPTGKHYLKSTASLISGSKLIGLGPNSILSSPEAVSSTGTEMITVLRSTGVSDILLQGLVIEGGCNEMVTTKRAVRGVRFIECQDVRVIDCEVNNTGDWALAFEKNDRVSVSRYKHRGSVIANLNGGRDGLHFLDCVDFSAIDLDIISGDDMVGCTSETRDQRNASIKGVRGYSGIGSCVIFNEEGITTNSTVNVLIDDVRVTSGQTVRNVVRVQSINGANVTGVIIKGIRGTGRNHGIQVTSAATMTNVDISDVNVTSVNQHGVYLNRINNLRSSGRAAAQNSSFDGWNIASCNYFDAQPAALSSPGWGVQVLNSAYFTMNGNCYNNGAGLFAAANGGNGRINGCSNYNVNGVYAGGVSTSYYGLLVDEVPSGRIDPATICNGFTPRSRPRNLNALRDAYAACSFGQTVSGAISSQGALNCSVELVSDGRYKINFTTPFESTFYRSEISVQLVNSSINIVTIAKDVSYYTFEVRNQSNVAVMANYILCEFKKAL